MGKANLNLLGMNTIFSVFDGVQLPRHVDTILIGILFARKFNIKHLWHVQEILAKPKLINQTFKKLLSSEYNDVAIYDSKETMRFWIEGNDKLTAKSDFVWNGLDVSKYEEVSTETEPAPAQA